MALSLSRHFTGKAGKEDARHQPSPARLVLALSLVMALGGCTVLESRTKAELAYEYQLSRYQLKAPELKLLHDQWLLKADRQSYKRLTRALPELTPDLTPVTEPEALDPSEQRVFQWLQAQQHASTSSASAQAHYALLIWLGYGNEKTQSERNSAALKLLRQSKRQNTFSQYLAGVIELETNPVSAEKHLKKAASGSYAPAQLALARLYLGQALNKGQGRLLLNDRQASRQLTSLINNSAATKANQQQAKAWLAAMNFYGIGGKRNTTAAYSLINSNSAVPELLYLKALMRLQGTGVKANRKEALQLLKQAAEAGSLSAANELAVALFNATPADSRAEEGRHYLHQAAASGSAVAAYNLGLSHYNGTGQPANLSTAEVWFNIAAKQKLPEAVRASLYLKLTDRGWFPDKQETAALKQQLEQLALQGDGWSSYALGTLLMHGQGQPASPQSGYAWLNVAVALGYQPAASLRDLAALQMTRPELNQAQTLSQSFFDRIQKVQEGTES